MKTSRQTKICIIIVGTILVVGSFGFPVLLAQLNLLVLSVTLVTLLWYTYDTHRIANQTIESALRPVILRQGKILDWKVNSTSDVEKSGFTLGFINQKNIAKDIFGYIVIDNKKFELIFGNEVTEEVIVGKGENIDKKIILLKKWGWLPIGGVLNSSYEIVKFEEVNQDNEIYIEYQDVESNKYFTKENKDFSQTSGKL